MRNDTKNNRQPRKADRGTRKVARRQLGRTKWSPQRLLFVPPETSRQNRQIHIDGDQTMEFAGHIVVCIVDRMKEAGVFPIGAATATAVNCLADFLCELQVPPGVAAVTNEAVWELRRAALEARAEIDDDICLDCLHKAQSRYREK